MSFKNSILKIVSEIPQGSFLTYKKVAELAGNPEAYRTVGNILAKNRNPKIPCHRVIRNDYLVGGYFGRDSLSWKKAALLLKEGAVGVIPTDTIYGICASAFNKKAVEKVYKLRKRDPEKPMIILIGAFGDLNQFGAALDQRRKTFLKKVWPGKVSVILKIIGGKKKFTYLHRGTKTPAFRLPRKPELLESLKFSGPLVAPSANLEGFTPAKKHKSGQKIFQKRSFLLLRQNSLRPRLNFD